jgi:hypothetical protein
MEFETTLDKNIIMSFVILHINVIFSQDSSSCVNLILIWVNLKSQIHKNCDLPTKPMLQLNFILLLGGCMVGWTNFGVTQSTFLLPRCDSYDHILLYILELFNGTHSKVMDFNMYIMKLIGMKIHKIVGSMDFWSRKSRYVTLLTMKWMDFSSFYDGP